MTTPIAVEAGSTLPLGTIIRRFGNNINMSGTGINIEGAGYYKVDASVSILATTAGNATVALYKDGVAVPGAEATVTLAVGDYETVSFPAFVRLQCCATSSTLTLVISETGGTVDNVALTVEKL